MSAVSAARIDRAQRERLAALADVLVPGDGRLPSAAEADVHRGWLDRVLAVRPDLLEGLLSALAQNGDPRAVVDRLRGDADATFDALTIVVTGAYFLNPRVRELLGLPGPVSAGGSPPERFDDDDVDGALLDVVRQRGPIYRRTRGER
jgi:hypothetical protein